MDRMIDVHSYFAGKRVAIAGEPDLLGALEHGLTAMGADVVAAFSPIPPASCGYDDAWSVGDFDRLEQFVSQLPSRQQPHLLLASTHGKQVAKRLGIEFMSVGLPIWDRVGAPNESSVLYRGASRLITQMANLLMPQATDE